MTALVEQPFWGCHELPLLPGSLVKVLNARGLEVPASPAERKPGKKIGSLARLCHPGWVLDTSLQGSRLELAIGALGSDLLASEDFSDALDVPIPVGRLAWADDLERLPLLVTTWSAIRTAGLTHADLSYLLSTGTVREAWEYLGDLEAAIDLAITTPAWVDAQQRVMRPAEPRSIAEAFSLARLRHVRQGGATLTNLSSAWVEGLGARAGITLEVQPPTLEEVGNVLGLTRERVRQVEVKSGIGHPLRRRWAVPHELIRLKSCLDSLVWTDSVTAQAEVDTTLGLAQSVPISAALRLLEEFGHPSAVHRYSDLLQPVGTEVDATIPKPAVRLAAQACADDSDFLRQSDLEALLANRFPDTPAPVIQRAIQRSNVISELPLGYAFRGSKKATIFGTTIRILSWAGSTSLHTVRTGLERRFRMRQFPSPPPVEVLGALFERDPRFIRSGDTLKLAEPVPPDRSTIQGRLATMIRESPQRTVHRAVLIDRAVNAGMNLSSVLVYLTFSEILVSVGQGCLTVVGDHPTPKDREEAAQLAAAIRLPTSLHYTSSGSTTAISIVVGHSFLGSGVLAIRETIARRFGNDRLPIFGGGQQRGHVGISGRANLFGLTPALTALGIGPGDTLTVSIDFAAKTVTAERE